MLIRSQRPSRRSLGVPDDYHRPPVHDGHFSQASSYSHISSPQSSPYLSRGQSPAVASEPVFMFPKSSTQRRHIGHIRTHSDQTFDFQKLKKPSAIDRQRQAIRSHAASPNPELPLPFPHQERLQRSRHDSGVCRSSKNNQSVNCLSDSPEHSFLRGNGAFQDSSECTSYSGEDLMVTKIPRDQSFREIVQNIEALHMAECDRTRRPPHPETPTTSSESSVPAITLARPLPNLAYNIPPQLVEDQRGETSTLPKFMLVQFKLPPGTARPTNSSASTLAINHVQDFFTKRPSNDDICRLVSSDLICACYRQSTRNEQFYKLDRVVDEEVKEEISVGASTDGEARSAQIPLAKYRPAPSAASVSFR